MPESKGKQRQPWAASGYCVQQKFIIWCHKQRTQIFFRNFHSHHTFVYCSFTFSSSYDFIFHGKIRVCTKIVCRPVFPCHNRCATVARFPLFLQQRNGQLATQAGHKNLYHHRASCHWPCDIPVFSNYLVPMLTNWIAKFTKPINMRSSRAAKFYDQPRISHRRVVELGLYKSPSPITCCIKHHFLLLFSTKSREATRK